MTVKPNPKGIISTKTTTAGNIYPKESGAGVEEMMIIIIANHDKLCKVRWQGQGTYIVCPALAAELSDSNQQAVAEGIKMVNLPEYDHSKCVMKETCIGYMNAQSDLDNEKQILLNSLSPTLPSSVREPAKQAGDECICRCHCPHFYNNHEHKVFNCIHCSKQGEKNK